MTTGLPSSVVLAGTFLLLLAGCAETPEDIANGDDPLKALAVGATSTRYNGPYWMRQRSAAPALYRDALAYCTAHPDGEKPNCAPVVATARFFESKARLGKKKGRGYTGILSEDAPGTSPDSLASGASPRRP